VTILKFGFHNFLNAQPLLTTLRKREKEFGFQLVLGSPAKIAHLLNKGEIDLGMIPSVEYLRNKIRYRLLKHFAIISLGPVDTVLLILKKQPERVERIALDAHSMTSAELIKILFRNRFRNTVHYETISGDPAELLRSFDAVLIIGDKAFSARRRLSNQTIIDLSEEWFNQTGKPFVHAVLSVRKDIELGEPILDVLLETETRITESISNLSKMPFDSLGLTSKQCEDYFRNKIRYILDPEALEGLNLFEKFLS
tara:strand:- start:337 stop:1098 length:762 start_codon:yes stop_codon:yes gene_type:complete